EHGDSEVLTWSLATIGGMPLGDFARLRGIEATDAPRLRQEIEQKVKGAAYSIIGGKGATYYGIGCALGRILDVVLHDQRAILTVCAPAAEVAGVRDVTVALPRLVGGQGVLETFPLPLHQQEMDRLGDSPRLIPPAPD